MKVGLGPGHIGLDGDTGLPSTKRTQPPIYGPYLLWSNGSVDQDATWGGGRPRSKRHCVRWGPSSPSPKRGQSPPQFSAHVYSGKTAGWIKMPLGTKVGLGPGDIVRWGPAPLPKKGGTVPNFRPVYIVANRSPISATAEHLFDVSIILFSNKKTYTVATPKNPRNYRLYVPAATKKKDVQ